MQLRQINLYIFIPSGHSRIRQRALTPLLVAKPKLALVVNTRIQLRRSLQLRRSKTAIPAALIIVNQPLKEFSVPSLQLSGLKLLIVSTEPAVLVLYLFTGVETAIGLHSLYHHLLLEVVMHFTYQKTITQTLQLSIPELTDIISATIQELLIADGQICSHQLRTALKFTSQSKATFRSSRPTSQGLVSTRLFSATSVLSKEALSIS
jgi:hypothetical protein